MTKVFKGVAALVFSLFFFANGLLFGQTQNFKDEWTALFQQAYYDGFRGLPPLKDYWMDPDDSGKVEEMQVRSYSLDALIAMYQTTDSLVYLRKAIELSNKFMGSAKVTETIPGNNFYLKDRYKGWMVTDTSHYKSVYHKETVLSEIYFFQYVAKLLRIIDQKSDLKKRFKSFYNTTLQFVENNIWDKWQSRWLKSQGDKNNFLYTARTDMGAHWAYIAVELSFVTTSESRRTNYLNAIGIYNQLLQGNFKRYDNYITWNQIWDTSTNKYRERNPNLVQDVSHGNLVVSYIVEAYDLGFWKDSDAVYRIINTLKDKLWDPTKCLFADNLDGSYFLPGNTGSVGSFQAEGFVKLTRYDKSLFDIYRTFISCNAYIKEWHQYGQLFANLALSDKLLQTQ